MTSQNTQPFLATSRRGRPQRFADVVGQSHITTVLQGALKRGKVSHAYLFSGPRGVGKTSTARILAKALNCESGVSTEPCNTCASCKAITAGNHIDCIEIDAASNRGIESIRDLREAVRFSPAVGRSKVYIIDEVHMLTPEAFNALLKTLEEPPAHCKFVLATTEEHKVPETILSRCQRFHFRRVSIVQIIENLKKIYSNEIQSLEIPDSVFNYVARAARGSLRDAQSVMDQIIAFSDDRVTLEDVETLLGVVEFEVLLDFIRFIHQGQIEEVLIALDAISQQGRDLGQFVRDLIELYRNLLVAQQVTDPGKLIDLPPQQMELTLETAKALETETLLRAIEVLFATENQLKTTVDDRLVVELASFKLAMLTQTITLRDLIARIEGWENYTPSPQAPSSPQNKPVPLASARKVSKETAPPEDSVKTSPDLQDRQKEIPTPSIPIPEPPPPPPPVESPEISPHSRIEMIDTDNNVSPQLWQLFLENLEEHSMRIASYLHAAQALSLMEDRMSIAIPKVHKFHYHELIKKKNSKVVEKILFDVFERKIQVEWVLKDIEVFSEEDVPPENEINSTQLIAEAAKDPHVKQVMDLFDGIVVDRRIRHPKKPSKDPSSADKKDKGE